jgi:hypothetical protein
VANRARQGLVTLGDQSILFDAATTAPRSSPDGQPHIGEKPDSQSASTWNKPGPLGMD